MTNERPSLRLIVSKPTQQDVRDAYFHLGELYHEHFKNGCSTYEIASTFQQPECIVYNALTEYKDARRS